MQYVLSKNLLHKEVSNGYYGIYNPLKDHSIIFVNSETYNPLLNFNTPTNINNVPIDEKIKQKLIQDKFLIPADADQTIPIKSLTKKLPRDPKFILMYLLLTDNCNLQCEYCFERGNEKSLLKKQDMPKQTASNAIDFFAQVADKNTKEGHKIIFYGGEPFLNRNTFEYSVRKLRNYEKTRKV